VASYVSEEFNRICTNAGVQCTVTADPQDFKSLYQFKNLSKHKVEISCGKAVYALNPNEEFAYKSMTGEEPKITQWFVWYQRVTNGN
jgi:hypothetical protein